MAAKLVAGVKNESAKARKSKKSVCAAGDSDHLRCSVQTIRQLCRETENTDRIQIKEREIYI